MNKYILSLDQGTTSTRALLMDLSGSIVGLVQKEITQIYPKNGWVEHDPEEILNSAFYVIDELIKKQNINPDDIKSIGITNQRETTVLWDKETGNPIHNAIVWQDNRTIDICDRLIKNKLNDKISQKTGLLIGTYFSATKIKWILDNNPQIYAKAKSGKILFGNMYFSISHLIFNKA